MMNVWDLMRQYITYYQHKQQILQKIFMQKKNNISSGGGKKDFKFKYENEWEDFLKLEGSLNKLLQNPDNFTFTQENFTRLIESTKQIASIIEMIKLERKSFNSVLEANKSIQAKLQNHNSIINALQQSYSDRIKSLNDQVKTNREQIDKIRKSYQEKIDLLQLELSKSTTHQSELQTEINQLKNQVQKLSAELTEKNNSITSLESKLQKVYKSTLIEILPVAKTSTLSEILTSNLNSHIIAYLHPKDVISVVSLNKLIRITILHSPRCIREIFANQEKLQQKKVNHFKKHIRHFQFACEKIPEEMVKMAFYKYMILKKQAGEFILPVLNSSAMLFQGKFVEVGFDFMYEDDLEEHEQFSQLQVDDDIRNMYLEESQQNRELITAEVDLMFRKIHNTAQLYSADVESIGLFLNNIERNYSKLFVFGKLLYNEAKQLQLLNSYLLKLTSDRQQFEIGKNSEIEDLKAQLDSQRKIKNFFSTKSLHSEQRALALENEKLNSELKLKELVQKYNDLDRISKANKQQIEDLEKRNTLLFRDNKIFKQNSQTINNRYNTVMQQLEILKDTLIKMNLN